MEPEDGQVRPKLVALIFNKIHNNITLAVDGFFNIAYSVPHMILPDSNKLKLQL
jgi:hypothetical protein